MKKLFICFIAAFISSNFLFQTKSESKTKQFSPCAVILEPTKGMSKNVRGVALIYNIERKFNDKRTSLSVNVLHMPEPSQFGDYDGYEVLASIPNEISWTFPLTKYKKNNWVGKWDEISQTMKPTRIKVRAYNSNTNKFGSVVLEKNVTCSR
ncbi:hypothetical protein ACIGEH_07955 [Bacillus altitudinis]|uniref:hypothetical protein n=1 Tax=Bacillus altitudinis TaxID=293387 RepID=UPI00227E1328|nr:hypothetical protein [Bacillus altitudinis]MCY7580353.1 hypothetical protein [Bacillus altitudinis]MCY7596595.1 hypothetical protein [Bacillus altitudinis]WJE29167.1 hypothetical protein QRD87_13915 [Bacillus altitudinis]